MVKDFAIISILFSTIIMIILSIEIIAFGKLIAKTPDGKELRGEKKRTEEDKQKWYSPEKMPMNFVKVLWGIQVVGCIVMLGAGKSTSLAVIGGCLLFSAGLFAATIGVFEIRIYRMMQTNIKEYGNSIIKVANRKERPRQKKWFPVLMHPYPKKKTVTR